MTKNMIYNPQGRLLNFQFSKLIYEIFAKVELEEYKMIHRGNIQDLPGNTVLYSFIVNYSNMNTVNKM